MKKRNIRKRMSCETRDRLSRMWLKNAVDRIKSAQKENGPRDEVHLEKIG